MKNMMDPSPSFQIPQSDRKGTKKKVGLQGAGGSKGSGEVMGVSNPRGMTPKKMPSKFQLVQGPREPKVGK